MTITELEAAARSHELRCAQDHRLSDNFTVGYRDILKLLAVVKAMREYIACCKGDAAYFRTPYPAELDTVIDAIAALEAT